jgi:hypothetical protein
VLLAGIFGSGTAGAAGSPNTWTTESPLSSAAENLAAVTSSSDNRTYEIDGDTGGTTYLGTTRGYTPGTNTWAAVKADSNTRTGPGAAATSDGTIYVFGGSNGSAGNHAETYTTSTNKWANLSNLPTSRYYLGEAVGSDGLVYAIGGQTNSTWLATVEAYSPSAAKWYCSTSVSGCTSTPTPPVALPTARSRFGIVAVGSLIYVIGGQTGSSSYTNVVEAYNPSTRTWTCSTGDTASGCSSTTLAPMPTARTTRAAAGSNGIIYAIGGYNGSSYLSYVEAYNPTTNSWECSSGDSAGGCSATPLTAMPTARAYMGLATGSDGNIYAIGGHNSGGDLTTVEGYSPLTLPGAPTIGTATAGDASATVTWAAPGSTGGSPVTSYTVSCSPACTGVSVAGSSATVTGLTNGTSYTFTVTATTFAGTGPSSASSNSVTPQPSCSTSSSNLSISGAAPGNFTATLNGKVQQLYTSLGSFTAGNTTCSGWMLQFQATRLACSTGTPGCPAGGNQLPAGSLVMAPPTVSGCQSACGSGSTANPPSICLHSNTAIDSGAAVTVASAAQSTGDGSYTFTPGTIGGGNLQLTMPSYAYATMYSSTLTVTIAQGPAGSC